jgi:hypothetical protein
MQIGPDGDIEMPDMEGVKMRLRRFLRENYEPVANARDADLHFTTREIYNLLQRVVPGPSYSIEEVTTWLDEEGYHLHVFGDMRLEWLMRRIN